VCWASRENLPGAKYPCLSVGWGYQSSKWEKQSNSSNTSPAVQLTTLKPVHCSLYVCLRQSPRAVVGLVWCLVVAWLSPAALLHAPCIMIMTHLTCSPTPLTAPYLPERRGLLSGPHTQRWSPPRSRTGRKRSASSPPGDPPASQPVGAQQGL
jgi:hypothetical protein